MIKRKFPKAQVTVFIIIGIVIVALIVLLVVLWPRIINPSVPNEFESAYNYYLGCIEEETRVGAALLGQGGGYLEPPEFFPGNSYLPFSSQLDFLGTGVPYWYYISGNNIAKEQIPSISKMELQLNSYLKERIDGCSFEVYQQEGYEIGIGPSEVITSIQDGKINVEVSQEVQMKYGDSYWTSSKHELEVKSALKKYYDLSKKIYLYNKQNMFLENYGLDVLRLYAPVDGSELGCSSKVWSVNEIRENLTVALQNNIPAIKIKGNYYENADKYFVRDIGENVDANVNFMFLRDWPLRLEIWPSEDGILRADPIGMQEGLGMLGFCYVPYHFVYDFGYPVLIQIYDDEFIFQFPVVVYIDKTMPRKAAEVEGLPQTIPELCEKKITDISVETYDINLNPVEADISYKCFDTTCNIGKTTISGDSAILTAKFPQCVNGYIIANALGYKKKKYLSSTLESGSESIVMKKIYPLEVEVKKNGEVIKNGYALITFKSEEDTIIVNYPQQKEVELTSGEYLIKAYIYSNSSLRLEGSSEHKCVTVPKSGFSGIFGGQEEKCFNIDIPSQTIDMAVTGGGVHGNYFVEPDLESSSKIIVEAADFGTPSKVEDLQLNYNKVETSKLNVYFES